MNKRAIHTLEIFWLIAGILSLGAGIHQTIKEGIGRSWLFFLLALISFAMYSLRRHMRKSSG